MKTPEKEIEQLIYKSPWLINERYLIARIKGSQTGENDIKENGRQVNIGKSNNRYIDILLKDSRDNRPVIIEIKKDAITRENIGQIQEYRSLIISMNESEKKEWIEEFGNNYYAPKMILIGGSASEDTLISAGLANIEVILFNRTELKSLELKELRKISKDLDTIGKLREKGVRTFKERINWNRNILSIVKESIIDIPETTTLDVISSFDEKRYYANKYSLFLDLPIFYKGEYLLGFYEYYVDPSEEQKAQSLQFSNEHIYCDFAMLIEDVENQVEINKRIKTAEIFLKSLNLEYQLYSKVNAPIILIPRKVLDNEDDRFNNLIRKLTIKAIEYYKSINR